MVLHPGSQRFQRIAITDLRDLTPAFEIQPLEAAQWRKQITVGV